jgi:threonine aldolase
MAARLRSALEGVPGLAFSHPTHANAIFAELDPAAADRVRERYRFYDWDRAKRQVRWMCAFDTTEDDVDAFVATVRSALA